MDKERDGYRLMAPGAPSSVKSYELPGGASWPRVDDHVVVPESSRDEMIGGEIFEATPANAPHSVRHSEIDYVLRGHVNEGYEAATDLLTRFSEEDDFASDTALLRRGMDPETGARYLEEVVFEVVSEQSEAKVRKKVPRMVRRGVRRVFGIFVKKGEVREWSPQLQTWELLDPSSAIEDPTLATPLPVAALLEAAAADDAVARALVLKDNPVITRVRAEAEARGKAEGEARAKGEAILAVLESRGLEVAPALRSQILAATDLPTLDRWLRRAAVVATSGDVVTE